MLEIIKSVLQIAVLILSLGRELRIYKDAKRKRRKRKRR